MTWIESATIDWLICSLLCIKTKNILMQMQEMWKWCQYQAERAQTNRLTGHKKQKVMSGKTSTIAMC